MQTSLSVHPIRPALLLAVLALTATAHAARPKMPGCTAGRFVVTEGQELLGGGQPLLFVQNGTVTIDGPCPATGKAKKSRRTGTPITARWKRCGERSRVRLVAKAADCTAVQGTVRAGKQRARFAAVAVAALECETAGYPCAWSGVAPEVVERSLALSQEAASRQAGGETAEQVGAFLASQGDVADVTVDGPVIAFRLAGGRPMIVDVTGAQEMLPSAPAAPTAAAAARTAGVAVGANVVVGTGPEKRGLVLSPFRYEENFGDAGEHVAGALNDVRGYEGRVTYLATTNEHDPRVTVDVLTQLESYDFVHVDTHGGSICKTQDAAPLTRSTSGPCQGMTDFLVQRFHGTAADLRSIQHPGVVHYRGRVHQSIAVTPDFFRHYYPKGLSDAVFVLGACNTFRPDMADAIAGDTSVFASWDHYTDLALVKGAGLALLDSFAQGLTVGAAFARMPPLQVENPETIGSSLLYTPRRAGGDLRLRELPRLLHPTSGKPLESSSSIEVKGRVDDGQPDILTLVTEIDGAGAADAGGYLVRISVEGDVVLEEPLETFAEQTGEYAWWSERDVALGFDVQRNQVLEIEVAVELPEGGESVVSVSPTVTGPAGGFAPGRVWQGTFKRTYYTGDTHVQIDVQATFERDPSDSPDTPYPTFLLAEGVMQWSLANNDGEGCSFQAPITATPLGPDPDANFSFDLTKDPVEFRGFASSDGPLVDLVVTCPETDPLTTKTEAGGVWLSALSSDHHQVSGYVFSGSYAIDSARPTFLQWTLHKVE